MKVINGLLLTRDEGSLIFYHPKGQKKIKLNLNKPWVYFPFSKAGYLTPIRIISSFHVDENEIETTPDTLIILNPDILINSRGIASASDCARRAFIDYIMGESRISLPMVRGSIIHEAFSNIVSQDLSVSKSLENSIEKFSFTLSHLSANLEELTNEIKPVLRGLAHSAPTLQNEDLVPEMAFLSPLYGILGRIDYWSPKELYELKTSRKVPSKERNTWYSDLMQTVIYMHGLSPTPKAVSKSYVIYSGIGAPSFRQTILDLNLIQKIHMARNYCYLVQYEGYIPPDLNSTKCARCFQQESCHFLLDIFNDENINSSKPFHYLTHFLSLVRLERLKNRQDFAFLWKFSPPGRVKTGKAISHLKLHKSEGETHEYSCFNTSELRRGEPVIVSQGNPIVDTTTMARIFDIERKKVTLNSQNKLPKEIFLDSYSSDFSFKRLNKNLFEISFGQKKNHKVNELVILGKKPLFKSIQYTKLEGLDQSQQEAIQLALNAKDYCLIQGPAGTGKTYTIAKLVEFLRNKNQKVLLTAYTNTAVDNMIKQYLKLSKIVESRKEIVRLGIDQAIDKEIVDRSLKTLKLQYQELEKIPIVAATTTTISSSLYDDLDFDIVIVDEASQMAEPHIVSAISKGEKFVLVGDDKQLPPLIQSSRAEKLGLNKSLFERLRKLHPHANVLLRYQYRMHDDLMDFSNSRYYNKKVQAATPKISKQLLWDILPPRANIKSNNQLFQTILDPNQPLVYVGLQSSFDRRKRVNKKESNIICDLISHYLKFGIKPEHIGVIAPFRGQVAEITRLIGTDSGVVVDTIDRFQGSDKELIILSLCTLSRPHILEDERRMNVALTRAKKKLIIVGDIPSNDSIKLFQELHSFINQNYSLVLIDQAKQIGSDLQVKPEIETKPKIESDFSFRSLNQEDINEEYTTTIKHKICILCQEPVNEDIELRCPVCNQAYHEDHLKTWLESNDVCVICQTMIRLA